MVEVILMIMIDLIGDDLMRVMIVGGDGLILV